MMLTRRELEDILSAKITDEQWRETEKSLANASENAWDEEHPLDD